jgi:hypothetical protein
MSIPMEELLFCWAKAVMRAEQAEAKAAQLEEELKILRAVQKDVSTNS